MSSSSQTYQKLLIEHLGFGRCWCNLRYHVLSTTSNRVSQRDPLSPMLFVLVMDVLKYMLVQASENGLVQSLAVQQACHRISFYEDDVIMFLRLTDNDLSLVNQFLNLFGHALGHKTNMSKSSMIPIQCKDEDLVIIFHPLPCEIKDFPCTNLGLQLSVCKPTKAELQPLVDKVANSLRSLAGRHLV